jgi:hypothetical protein
MPRERPASAEEPGRSPWVGQVIDGRYRIDRALGEGAMGAVFAAEHLKLQKPVALKIILPEHAGDAELAQRFAREAMVSAKLDHPHVASAMDCGSLPDGGAYLVMQLARGRSLREWMHRRADWRAAVEIGRQIADALAAAHAHGIVHRDLKPENVMIEERDGAPHARVLDFGLAGIAEGAKEGAPLTRLGTVMGTPGYMAPEQAVGEVADARADVYALGVIVWELSTGRTLFTQDDLGAITLAQLTTPAPRLASLVPDVPSELDALVARMVASARADRPENGSVCRDALREIALGSVAANRASGASTPGMAAAPVREALPSMSTVAPDAATEIARVVGAAPTFHVPPQAPTLPVPAPRVAMIVAAGALALVATASIATRAACSGAATEASTSLAPRPGIASPDHAPPTAPDVPAALAADLALLSTGADEAARSGAAARLLPHQAELPTYARMVLAYETASECDDRREAIRGLRVLRDPRALEVLYRIVDDDRRDDRCLRRDLERAIETLSSRD